MELHSFLVRDVAGFEINKTGGDVSGGWGTAGARRGDDSQAKGGFWGLWVRMLYLYNWISIYKQAIAVAPLMVLIVENSTC